MFTEAYASLPSHYTTATTTTWDTGTIGQQTEIRSDPTWGKTMIFTGSLINVTSTVHDLWLNSNIVCEMLRTGMSVLRPQNDLDTVKLL